jgi:hypothetical protein
MAMASPKPVPRPASATGLGPPRSTVPGSIEYKQAILKRCFVKMAIGVVLVGPLFLMQAQHRIGMPGSGLLVILFFLPALVMFVFACVDYAKSKGMHPAMGLLGLGSIVGLIILSLWPDRYAYDSLAKQELKAASKQQRKS